MPSYNSYVTVSHKNHRHQRKCITLTFLDDPLLIAATALELSHSKSTCLLDSAKPQTAQLSRTGINSLAMMPNETHPASHCHWSYIASKNAPHPQEPEASAWMEMSNDESELLQCNKLKQFQLLRKEYHQHKYDRNDAFNLV